jgi:predicted ester cyclase
MTVGVRDGERKEEIRAMSEENKALARRYLEEVWDKGNVDLIDELFTTDFVRHGPPAVEGEVRGPEGFKGLVSTYHAGFPDFRVTIDDMIAEGELMGNAPTGNQVTFTGYLFDRISGGKMREAVSKHSPTSAPS